MEDFSQQFGAYTKSFITDLAADLTAEDAIFLHNTLQKFPEEAIYVYSFEKARMIYAYGWEEVLGYADNEISMLKIVTMTSPEFAPFVHEVNDKALMFIQKKKKDLDKYGFIIEQKKIHKNGSEVPIIARVGIYETKNGEVLSIIGRFQVNRNLRFGKILRYAAYGPEKNEFEEELNTTLFYKYAISDKEKEALALVSKGFSFKEIAHQLGVSKSAIEKRILPLYKRFDVKSLTHLVSFAYDNNILP